MFPQDGGVWFPTIRAGTGVDSFTELLADGLRQRGIRAEIEWLPHSAEYLPWLVKVPKPPDWASIVHVNSWIHRRFIPCSLPCVVTLHSCVHDPAYAPYKSVPQTLYHRLWVYKREVESIEKASAVTAVSEYTESVAREVFPQLPVVHGVPNWVRTDVFFPAIRTLPGKPFRLLFVGNVSARKGEDILVKTMARLGSSFQLSYTGNPEDFSKPTELPDNMVPLGKIMGPSAMAEVYRAHDAFLFPSRLEGLPLSVLEAASSGLPVIASNCSSLPEVVRHRETGLLCKMDDVSAFVDAVQLLADFPDIWGAMSSNARQLMKANFAMERAVDRYVDIYRSVAR